VQNQLRCTLCPQEELTSKVQKPTSGWRLGFP
jgi:hypothetical protein